MTLFILVLFASPVAKIETISLVLVSPSHEIALNVVFIFFTKCRVRPRKFYALSKIRRIYLKNKTSKIDYICSNTSIRSKLSNLSHKITCSQKNLSWKDEKSINIMIIQKLLTLVCFNSNNLSLNEIGWNKCYKIYVLILILLTLKWIIW